MAECSRQETPGQSFKRCFSRDVEVHFVGVWVSALFRVLKKRKPLTATDPIGHRLFGRRNLAQDSALCERIELHPPLPSSARSRRAPSLLSLPTLDPRRWTTARRSLSQAGVVRRRALQRRRWHVPVRLRRQPRPEPHHAEVDAPRSGRSRLATRTEARPRESDLPPVPRRGDRGGGEPGRSGRRRFYQSGSETHPGYGPPNRRARLPRRSQVAPRASRRALGSGRHALLPDPGPSSRTEEEPRDRRQVRRLVVAADAEAHDGGVVDPRDCPEAAGLLGRRRQSSSQDVPVRSTTFEQRMSPPAPQILTGSLCWNRSTAPTLAAAASCCRLRSSTFRWRTDSPLPLRRSLSTAAATTRTFPRRKATASRRTSCPASR